MCGQRETEIEQFAGFQVELQPARVAGGRETVTACAAVTAAAAGGPGGVQCRQALHLLTVAGDGETDMGWC